MFVWHYGLTINPYVVRTEQHQLTLAYCRWVCYIAYCLIPGIYSAS